MKHTLILKHLFRCNDELRQWQTDLEISFFPQIYILKRPEGYVDPSLWEDGIPAALVSYDINGWHSEGNGTTSESAYMGLRYGLNMGAWRLRSRGNWHGTKDNGSKYSSRDIYLQRDITALTGQFVIGDSIRVAKLSIR